MRTGRHNWAARRRGFTLVELIVATAITTIILGSIVALFVLALRAVKSGNAAMDANEMTRAAFQLMERDLNTAFTSREHGEFYHFHGNEVGFSFIGLARTFTGSGDELQLGRVTYVINPVHESMVNGFDDDNNGTIDDNCDRYVDTIFMERLESGEMVEAQLVDPACDVVPPGVLTVSLLRYFEPGVETLDEYAPAIKQRLDNAFVEGYPGIGVIEEQALQVLDGEFVRDAQMIDEVRRIFRRDAYIRMLANAQVMDPYRNSAFASSDAWDMFDPPKNKFDYVVASNILDIQSQKLLANGDTTPFHTDDLERFPYFLYGRTATSNNVSSIAANVEYATNWNAFGNMYVEAEDADGNKLGYPVALKDTRVPVSALPGAPEVPQFGTPLESRLPEIVRVRLPFIFDSPYSGAPHLQRELQQDIRVPSAYTRRNPLAENTS